MDTFDQYSKKRHDMLLNILFMVIKFDIIMRLHFNLPLTRKASGADKDPLSLDTWHSYSPSCLPVTVSMLWYVANLVLTTTRWGTKSPVFPSVSTFIPSLVHVAYVGGPPVDVQVSLKMGRVASACVCISKWSFPIMPGTPAVHSKQYYVVTCKYEVQSVHLSL